MEEQEKAIQKMEETAIGIKQYVINCIVNNEPNAAEMKELAQKIIAMKKGQGIYDHGFWVAIE